MREDVPYIKYWRSPLLRDDLSSLRAVSESVSLSAHAPAGSNFTLAALWSHLATSQLNSISSLLEETSGALFKLTYIFPGAYLFSLES